MTQENDHIIDILDVGSKKPKVTETQFNSLLNYPGNMRDNVPLTYNDYVSGFTNESLYEAPDNDNYQLGVNSNAYFFGDDSEWMLENSWTDNDEVMVDNVLSGKTKLPASLYHLSNWLEEEASPNAISVYDLKDPERLKAKIRRAVYNDSKNKNSIIYRDGRDSDPFGHNETLDKIVDDKNKVNKDSSILSFTDFQKSPYYIKYRSDGADLNKQYQEYTIRMNQDPYSQIPTSDYEWWKEYGRGPQNGWSGKCYSHSSVVVNGERIFGPEADLIQSYRNSVDNPLTPPASSVLKWLNLQDETTQNPWYERENDELISDDLFYFGDYRNSDLRELYKIDPETMLPYGWKVSSWDFIEDFKHHNFNLLGQEEMANRFKDNSYLIDHVTKTWYDKKYENLNNEYLYTNIQASQIKEEGLESATESGEDVTTSDIGYGKPVHPIIDSDYFFNFTDPGDFTPLMDFYSNKPRIKGMDGNNYNVVQYKPGLQGFWSYKNEGNLYAMKFEPSYNLLTDEQRKNVVEILSAKPGDKVNGKVVSKDDLKMLKSTLYVNGYRLYNAEGFEVEGGWNPTISDPWLGSTDELWGSPDKEKNPELWEMWKEYQGQRTAGDVWKEWSENPVKFMPYVGTVAEGTELYEIWRISEQLAQASNENGTLPSEDDMLVLYEYILKNEQAFRDDGTFGANFTQGLFDMIPFGLEIASSWGLYNVTKKVGVGTVKLTMDKIFSKSVKEALEKYIGKNAKRKIFKNSTSPYLKNVTVGNIIDNGLGVLSSNVFMNEFDAFSGTGYSNVGVRKRKLLMPNFRIDQTSFDILMQTSTLDDETAEKYARADAYIESLSESSGYYFLGPMLSRFKPAGKNLILKNGLFKKFTEKNPFKRFNEVTGGSYSDYTKLISNVFKSMGYDGIMEEMLEEEVGRGARATLHSLGENGVIDPKWAEAGFEWEWPTMEEYITQLAVFSVPAGVTGSISGANNYWKNKKWDESEIGKNVYGEHEVTDKEVGDININVEGWKKKIDELEAEKQKLNSDIESKFEQIDNTDESDTESINKLDSEIEILQSNLDSREVEIDTELNELNTNLNDATKSLIELNQKKATLNAVELFARQNPDFFDDGALLDIIDKTREITIEDLKAKGWDTSKIEEFWEGEGLDSDTKVADVLGSTEWKEFENETKVVISLYQGATADTVLEEMFGFSYKMMGEAEQKLWNEYWKKSDTKLTEQEFFEKEAKGFFYQNKGLQDYKGLKGKAYGIFQKGKDALFSILNLHEGKLDPRIRDMYIKAGLLKPIGQRKKQSMIDLPEPEENIGKTPEEIKKEIEDNDISYQLSEGNLEGHVDSDGVYHSPVVTGQKYLYHVTTTEKLDNIKAEGLQPFKDTMWEDPSGNRQGQGQVFVFENINDANDWASKINFDLGQDAVVLKVRNIDDLWEEDVELHGDKVIPKNIMGPNKGRWLKRHEPVQAEDIVGERVLKQGHLLGDNPLNKKKKDKTLEDSDFFEDKQNTISYQIKSKAPAFIDNSLEKVSDAPWQKTNKQSLIPYLKKRGITDAEIKELEIEELEDNKTYTKQEILEHLLLNKSNIVSRHNGTYNMSAFSVGYYVPKPDKGFFDGTRYYYFRYEDFPQGMDNINFTRLSKISELSEPRSNTPRAKRHTSFEENLVNQLKEDNRITKHGDLFRVYVNIADSEFFLTNPKVEDSEYSSADELNGLIRKHYKHMETIPGKIEEAFDEWLNVKMTDIESFRIHLPTLLASAPNADGKELDDLYEQYWERMTRRNNLPFARLRQPGDIDGYFEEYITLPSHAEIKHTKFADHFKDWNVADVPVFMHIRYTIRTNIDGVSYMFVEEIQSDYEQQVGDDKRQLKAFRKKQIEFGNTPSNLEIEKTPYGKFNWIKLGLKRIIRTASNHGVDKITFVTPAEVAKDNSPWYKFDKIQYTAPRNKWGDDIYDINNWILTPQVYLLQEHQTIEDQTRWSIKPTKQLKEKYPNIRGTDHLSLSKDANIWDVFEHFYSTIIKRDLKIRDAKYYLEAFIDGEMVQDKAISEAELYRAVGKTVATQIIRREGETRVEFTGNLDLLDSEMKYISLTDSQALEWFNYNPKHGIDPDVNSADESSQFHGLGAVNRIEKSILNALNKTGKLKRLPLWDNIAKVMIKGTKPQMYHTDRSGYIASIKDLPLGMAHVDSRDWRAEEAVVTNQILKDISIDEFVAGIEENRYGIMTRDNGGNKNYVSILITENIDGHELVVAVIPGFRSRSTAVQFIFDDYDKGFKSMDAHIKVGKFMGQLLSENSEAFNHNSVKRTIKGDAETSKSMEGFYHDVYDKKLTQFLNKLSIPLDVKKEKVTLTDDMGFDEISKERIVVDLPDSKKEEITDTSQPSYQLNKKKKDILNNESLELDEATNWQWVLHGIQDDFVRMKYIQENIGKIPEELDVYMKHEQYSGKTANKVNEFREYYRDLLSNMRDDDVGIEDFGEYLYFRHAKERNKHIKETYDKEDGSGKTKEEIKDYWDGLDPVNKALYEKYAKEFDQKIIKEIRVLLLDSGLISQKTFDKLDTHYKFYVPLKGVAGKDTFSGVSGGYANVKSGVIGARGRRSSANNPFAQALADYERTLQVVQKNEVLKSLHDFMIEYPEPTKYEVSGKKYLPNYDKEGNLEIKPIHTRLAPNEIGVFIDGKTKVITVHDKLLLRELKKPISWINQLPVAKFKIPGFDKTISIDYPGLLRKFSTWFRTINTSLRPTFIVRNFIRDAQTAGINMLDDNATVDVAWVYKNIMPAIRGIYREHRGKSDKTGWGKWYKEFKADGGKVGWMDQATVEQKLDEIEKIIKQLTETGKEKEALYAVSKFIEDVNMSVENGVRLAIYRRMRENGVSRDKSAVFAKSVTVNFNRKGEIGSTMNMLFIFSNAGVQGTATLLGKAHKSKKVRRALAGVMVTGFFNSMIQRMLDPEDWEMTDKWERDNKIIIRIPGFKNPMTIPLGYGINFFWAMGSIAEDMVATQGWYQEMLDIPAGSGSMSAWDTAWRMGSSMGTAFNPLGSSNLGTMLFPTITKPVVEYALNTNWMGNKIYRDKETKKYGVLGPDHTRHFNSVRPYTKDATQWIYDNVGADINPEGIDYFMDAYLGGVFKDGLDAIAFGQSLVTPGEIDWSRMPVGNIFIRRSKGWGPFFDAKSMFDESGRIWYNKNQIQKYYNMLGHSKKSGKLDEEWYQKDVKEFRKNQFILTGVLPPRPGQSWDDPKLVAEQIQFQLELDDKKIKKEKKEEEKKNEKPLSEDELYESLKVTKKKKKKKKSKKRKPIEYKKTIEVKDDDEEEVETIKKTDTKKDTVDWMSW